jgi:hypothetical protein
MARRSPAALKDSDEIPVGYLQPVMAMHATGG